MRAVRKLGPRSRGRVIGILSLPLAALMSAALAAPAHASSGGPLLTTIALWHMDETSGQMIDSAKSHDSTAVVDVTRGVPGKIGTAYSFNGTSSIVKVPSASDLNPGSGTFSVTVYVHFLHTPESQGEDSYDLVRKGITGEQYWKLEISKTGKFTCHFTGSTGTFNAAGKGSALNGNAWHKLNCQKTTTSVTMSVDGVQIYSQTVTVGTVTNSELVTLGAKVGAPNSDFLKGKMDEVRIATG
jgi:hypothetical protein